MKASTGGTKRHVGGLQPGGLRCTNHAMRRLGAHGNEPPLPSSMRPLFDAGVHPAQQQRPGSRDLLLGRWRRQTMPTCHGLGAPDGLLCVHRMAVRACRVVGDALLRAFYFCCPRRHGPHRGLAWCHRTAAADAGRWRCACGTSPGRMQALAERLNNAAGLAAPASHRAGRCPRPGQGCAGAP